MLVRTVESDRIARLTRAVAGAELDAVVVTSQASIAYLTGWDYEQYERLAAVVVRADGSGAIVASDFAAAGSAVAPGELARALYPPSSDGMPELLAVLDGARRVGVEEGHLVHARARALARAGRELADAGELVGWLRARKDAVEVASMERACAIVGDAIEALFASLRPGVVEREACAQVDGELRRIGASAVVPIVQFGAAAADPDGASGERSLAVGDVVCVDVSARIDGYWADLTRCGVVGPAGDWARAAWEAVTRAQAAAIATAVPGALAGDADAAQRELLTGVPQLGDVLHGAGHGLGIELHEPPYLIPGARDRFAEGMVVAVEPGLYRPGVGGLRLEDDVLVTAQGPRLLSAGVERSLRELPVA